MANDRQNQINIGFKYEKKYNKVWLYVKLWKSIKFSMNSVFNDKPIIGCGDVIIGVSCGTTFSRCLSKIVVIITCIVRI